MRYKEFVIAAKRLGQFVIACDSYHNAPAMQVADKFEVFDMLNGDALDAIIEKWNPDIIIPEIEAIRTERLYQYEENGIQIVPSAKAVNYTMNRKAIRDLAAFDLGLKTAKFLYAKSLEELHKCVQSIGFPCVVKPLMSSSGKGQTVVKSEKDIEYVLAVPASTENLIQLRLGNIFLHFSPVNAKPLVISPISSP